MTNNNQWVEQRGLSHQMAYFSKIIALLFGFSLG